MLSSLRVGEDLDSILTVTMVTTIHDNDDAYRVGEVLNCILTTMTTMTMVAIMTMMRTAMTTLTGSVKSSILS